MSSTDQTLPTEMTVTHLTETAEALCEQLKLDPLAQEDRTQRVILELTYAEMAYLEPPDLQIPIATTEMRSAEMAAIQAEALKQAIYALEPQD